MIVVTGARDHTKEGTHPGTTLVQLKRQHPHLSKMVGAGDTIVVYKEPAPFFGC